MLKIVHLLAGAAALLVALLPVVLGKGSLLDANTVALSLIGLLNLSHATTQNLPTGNARHFHYGASGLLLVAALLQVLAVTTILARLAGQPTLLASLILSLLAVFAQLGAAYLPRRTSAPQRHRRPRRAAQAQPYTGGSQRENGTVKWFNTSKGFGFISRDDGQDIFVHFRAIRGEGHRILVEGQRVEYSVMQHDKGLQAEDVVVVGGPRR